MPGLTRGALLAIGVVVGVAAVGALAFRAWQVIVPAPIVATTAPAAGAPTAAGAASEPQAAPERPAASQTPQPALPGFDIVRVEPTGETVVAGRATPNAEVALLDRGSVIAKTQADANGQFTILPPPLAGGDHLLALGETSANGQVISTQTVTVVVPKAKGAGDVVVALTEPDQPTRVLSAPSGATPANGAAQDTTASATVAIRTVEMDEHGGFFATGSAPPGAPVRLYLNGSAVGDLRAGPDGHWSLDVQKGLSPGSYTVRADQLDATGKTVAQAQVPFDMKAFAVAEANSGPDARKAGSASDAVADISTVKVVHGDSLWRISRKVFGRGIRYTEIYAANTTQIHDPRLIYPGQVLVEPHPGPN